jgi:hypothetical protein
MSGADVADTFVIRPSLALAIQDAILLGHVKEIDAILTRVGDDADFPKELRYGLEALRHFRAHYGQGGALYPQDDMQKKKITLMESAWGAELLEIVRQGEESALAKSA